MIASIQLRRLGAAVLLAALGLAASIALGACGGGGGTDDSETLLDRAFTASIPSANVKIESELGIDGLAGFEEPLEITARGPYVAGRNRLPQFDLDIEIGSDDLGQTVQAGLLSTGGRLFVRFAGSHFEQDRADVARANRQLAEGGGADGGSLGDLGVDARAWVEESEVVGEAKVGGVETEHVEGTLDVRAMLEDLNGLIRRSAGLTGGSQRAEPLSRDQVDRLARVIESPSFDVYVGKEDRIIRRLSVTLDANVPEEERERVGGIEAASVRFSAQFDDVGGDQRVAAPERSRPISELTSQLGGLSLLGVRPFEGSEGSGDGGSPGADDPLGSTSDETVPDAAEPNGDSGADAFQRYGECLDRARPDESDAISRCSELLE